MQRLMKADRLGDSLIETGQEIKRMLADGYIDPEEAVRLSEIAMSVMRDGIEAYDVAADAKNAAHILRCGREEGRQTYELKRLDADIQERRQTFGSDSAARRRGLVDWDEKEAA